MSNTELFLGRLKLNGIQRLIDTFEQFEVRFNALMPGQYYLIVCRKNNKMYIGQFRSYLKTARLLLFYEDLSNEIYITNNKLIKGGSFESLKGTGSIYNFFPIDINDVHYDQDNQDINVNETTLNDTENEPIINININSLCLDLIMYDEVPIRTYLQENNAVVFIFFDNNIMSSSKVGIEKMTLLKALNENSEYIIYECKTPNTMRPENIITNVKYFDIKKLCGYGDFGHNKVLLKESCQI